MSPAPLISRSLSANPNGSMWHRWDPHLHAPGTLLSDQFNGDWDAYLRRIENATPAIMALGVTDYFCIRTYREVRKRKAEGRLGGVQCLFPNVEMRLDTKTTDQRAINIHLLFSPADPDHEVKIERILGHLNFEFKETQYRCEPAHFVALGKHFDPSQTDNLAAMKVGANQFKTTLKDLKGLFKNERWMRDNALVAIASKSGDGTAGLQADEAFSAMRIELERFADVIFSGREKDRSFWLGEEARFPLAFIEERYRGLKPCLNGSDAHREETTGVPPKERFCWIKGDLTFETLRQAVVEPGERVWIGRQPPSNAIPASVVRKILLTSAPWMSTGAIELNSGLVAIVGARGSGKTALADVIAMGAYAADAGKGDASFLKRASSPIDHLGDAAVQLMWGDDSTTTAQKLKPGGLTDQPEMVRYLSQHFVERLCSASGLATDLRGAMERVVFESTDPLERLEADTFDELADRLLEPIHARYDDLQRQVDIIGDAIVQEDILLDRQPALKLERAGLAKKIDSARKEQQKLIPKGDAARVALLAILESACIAGQAKVESLRRRQRTIDDLEAAVRHQEEATEPTRFATMQQKYVGAQLTADEWKAFRLEFAGDTTAAAGAARIRANRALQTARDGDPAAPTIRTATPHAQWPLNLLIAERDSVKAAVGIDAARQKKYDDAQRQIGLDELSMTKIDGQLEQAGNANARKREHMALRRGHYVQVFEQLIQEEAVLGRLYAPLKQRLQNSTGALAKLTFVIERTVDLEGWCQRGEEHFDLRSGERFRGRGAIRKAVEEHLAAAWRKGSAEDVAAAMDHFREELQKELKNMPPWVSPEQRRAWNKGIASWLYDTAHIKLRYGIEYEGVAIEQLSPGTRGVVLLLLYLAVDLQDQRPLIIDQPEENLDPNSVFEELVPHFRDARSRRQVIIVTHNANLVVNTDADQVLVANAVRGATGALPKINYQSGSLENPTIRGLVCQILEGGERAFLEREQRYRLRWGHNLLEEPDPDFGTK